MVTVSKPRTVVGLDPRAKEQILAHLRSVEGHLRGILRMVEEDGCCVDVLKQTFAVRRAIEKMEALMLEGHLQTCVVDGIKGGREEAVVEELVGLYELSNK